VTATVVKERGIIFSGPMVRRVLDGSKWQTRRLVNPQPEITFRDIGEGCAEVIWKQPKRLTNAGGGSSNGGKDILQTIAHKYSPYGRPGDRLWVRENFSYWHGTKEGPCWYWADGNPEQGDYTRPKPSIHMPRWASRILLELTAVWVQRVQDITEGDAKAEGARHFPDLPSRSPYGQDARWSMEEPKSTDQCLGTARMAFANYINQLHGGKNWNLKPSSLWDENPWVWVLAFRRIES